MRSSISTTNEDWEYTSLMIRLFLSFRGRSFASVLLMVVIYAVVLTKGLRGFSGIAIGGIVGLDIFFLGLVPVLQ